MKDKKGRKYIKTNFNCIEEFKTNKENPTKDELKIIFNKKYFRYIKRIENREKTYLYE